MSRLIVNNLSCRYHEKEPVLDDVSFSVSSGESVAIIGPSGSGKTTLAYCLSGIIPNKVPCEVTGEIFLDGINLLGKDLKEFTKRINVVMQSYEFQIFGLTVEEDIMFGLENLTLNRDEFEKRLNWALKTFGLDHYRNYHVFRLSGGLKKRLVIASTVAMQPDFLVMDDPTSNLDWGGIKDLKGIICQLKRQGKGIIIMTRRTKGLEGCIDRTLRLKNGTIEGHMREGGSRPLKPTPTKKTSKVVLVEMKDLWFRYLERYVLQGVNLRFHLGEVTAVMGPNGSGKTTLIKHVNGLLKPTKGNVTVMGRNTKTHSVAELARYVGFVFQDPDRHLTFETVWDEVVFGCRNLGLSFDEAERVLKALGLYKKKKRAPYSLSMGEKVRLMIASALSTKPSILVLDEPTTGQDERTLRSIEQIILRMKEEGKCVIVVTHDSDFALKVSDRVVVIKEGSVVADASPSDILLDDKLVKKFKLEPPAGMALEMRV